MKGFYLNGINLLCHLIGNCDNTSESSRKEFDLLARMKRIKENVTLHVSFNVILQRDVCCFTFGLSKIQGMCSLKNMFILKLMIDATLM